MHPRSKWPACPRVGAIQSHRAAAPGTGHSAAEHQRPVDKISSPSHSLIALLPCTCLRVLRANQSSSTAFVLDEEQKMRIDGMAWRDCIEAVLKSNWLGFHLPPPYTPLIRRMRNFIPFFSAGRLSLFATFQPSRFHALPKVPYVVNVCHA